jgi:alkylation response protein AidB-like acyl-CoA dehydrogenase
MTAAAFDALAAADRLAPLLAARSREIEAARSLPPDVADLLADAGLYGLLMPRACGGPELHVAAFFEVIERLAQADAASAWCCFISSTTGVLAAYLDPATATALFNRSGVKLAGVFAPRGRAVPEVHQGVAGYRVSGRWSWGSGVANADFVSGGCVIAEAGADGPSPPSAPSRPSRPSGPSGPPRVLSVLFERGQVQRHDNWHSMGLCGTGSGDFEVHGQFVPAARTASLFAPPRQAGTLYRFPVFGLLALGIAAVALGIARQAMTALVDLAAAKVPQASSKTLAERPATQAAVARAEAEWRGARAFLLDALHAAWNAGEREGAPGPIPVDRRRDLRLATTHAVHTAAAVTTRLYTLAGGSAVFADSPLQRCLRDVHVATQHMMVAESTFELTGRLLLGLPAEVAML